MRSAVTDPSVQEDKDRTKKMERMERRSIGEVEQACATRVEY